MIGYFVSFLIAILTFLFFTRCKILRGRKRKLKKSTYKDVCSIDNFVPLSTDKKYRRFKTFPELIRYRAKVNPNRVCYVWVNKKLEEGGRCTFSELLSMIRGLATSKQFRGLKKGDKVFLMLAPGLQYNIAYLTCLYIGVIPLPLYPPRKYKRDIKNLAYAAEKSKAKHIITTSAIHYKFLLLALLVENFKPTRFTWIHLPNFSKIKKKFGKSMPDKRIEKISATLNEDDIAYIQFSSGTTQSTQKGIIVKYKQFMRCLYLVHEKVTPPEPGMNYWTQCTFAPPYADTGLFLGLGSSIYLGCTSVLFSPLEFFECPKMWLECMNKFQCSYSLTVNECVEYMIKNVPKSDYEKYPIPEKCYVVIGATTINPRTIRRFYNKFKYNKFVCGYGLTEFTLAASISHDRKAKVVKFQKKNLYKGIVTPVLDENAQEETYIELVSCGKIVRDAQHAIVDPKTLKELEPLRIGELLLSDDSVCESYLNEEELTKNTFNTSYRKLNGEASDKSFLRTNDFCFMFDNELYFVDRISDQIHYKGKSVFPFLIESIVDDSHDFIKTSLVVMLKKYNKLEEDQIVVVVEIFKKHSKKYLEPIFQHINIDVGKEFGIVPSFIMLVKENSLPKTASHKYSRFALKEKILQKKILTIEVKDNSSIKDQEDLSYFDRKWEGQEDFVMKDAEREKGITNYLFAKLERLRDLDKKHTFIMSFIKERVSKVIDVENIDVTQPLASYGLSSLMAVQLTNELSKSVGKKISATLLFNYPTIEKLSFFLETSIFKIRKKTEYIIKGILGIDEKKEDIAVIGMGCKFSGGSDEIEKFWDLLKNGKSGVNFIPNERWNIDEYFDPDPDAPGKMYTKKGGFIDNVDCFDSTFFRISPREAELMDPQQRILMEVSWNTFENAGIVPKTLFESKTGVFIACCGYDYSGILSEIKAKNPEMTKKFDYRYVGTGTSGSVLAGRVSYFYGFQGPAITVDTACSSSLVGTHIACQALQNRECDLALSGGVNITLDPQVYVTFTKTRMLSPDGQCKTFDENANGYVRGEGCGLILLKRYSDAIRDGDRILGVIKGSAYNQDGRSAGITAPNSLSQEVVIKTALYNAEVHANEVDYVEAHGTGTSLGDPIEIQSLMSVFGGKERTHPLTIGSVKTNIGHCEGAAGIAGMLKILLSLQNEYIPKHLNLSTLNTRIPLLQFQMVPMFIPYVEGMEWERNERRRIAGVSSFGFSGTNCHVIIGEGPEFKETDEPEELENDDYEDGMFEDVFCVSAQSKHSLKKLLEKYQSFLVENFEEISFHSLCYSQNITRTHFEQFRVAFKCDTLTKFTSKIESFVKNETTKLKVGVFQPNKNTGGRIGGLPKVVFLFTGQGSQYLNMGKELYEKHSVFRMWMDKCNNVLKPLLAGVSILDLIYSVEEDENLQSAKFVQPCLFSLEYSISKLWISWGIDPDVVMGHSLGEIVAACISDVMSLEDGLKLITLRGKYMSEAERGGMAAIFTSKDKVKEMIPKSNCEVSMASINGPTNVVISGSIENVDLFLEYVSSEKIKFKKLNVTKAFHSEMMDSILDDFERSIRRISYDIPVFSIVSNLYGEVLDDDSLKFKLDSKYWKRHIRNPVLFLNGVEALMKKNESENILFLEVGAQNHLISMIKRIIPDSESHRISFAGTLNPKKSILLNSICQIYALGFEFDWNSYYNGEILKHKNFLRTKVNKFNLPVYPFQKKKFDVYSYKEFTVKKDAVVYSEKGETNHPLIGNKFIMKNKTIFQKKINKSLFSDHQIFNYQIFPATGYLEIILDCGLYHAKGDKEQVVCLKRLVLEEPLKIKNDLVLQTHCTMKEDGTIYAEVVTIEDEESWKHHFSTSITLEDVPSHFSKETFDNLASSYKPVDIGIYDLIQKFGYNYGETFSLLTDVYTNGKMAIGKVSIHPDVHEAGRYHIHPSIVDSCLHSLIPLIFVEKEKLGTYLPFSIRDAKFYSSSEKMVEKVWVKTNLKKMDKGYVIGDFSIYSQKNNEILVELKDFELREVSKSMFEKLIGEEKKIFFASEWEKSKDYDPSVVEKRVKYLARNLEKTSRVIVFGDTDGLGSLVAKTLGEYGMDQPHIVVEAGEEFERGENRFTINFGAKKDYEKLFSDVEVQKCNVFLHLLSLDVVNLENEEMEKKLFESNLLSNCISVMQIIKTSVQKGIKFKLICVTRGVHDIENTRYQQSPLWGMARTISIEHSDLDLVMVDLDNKKDLSNETLQIIEQMFLGKRKEGNLIKNEISFKNGNLYFCVLKEKNIPEKETPSFENKTFVVSGGLGGLGKVVGKKLLELKAKKVILLTRREVSEDIIKKNKGLLIEKADVTDLKSLFGVFETHKPNGIVHCAGVWSDSLLINMEDEDFKKVILPKVVGTYNLHVISKAHKIEDFILFSSSASTFGSPGQCNYTAGNYFLGSLSQYRWSKGLPSLNIQWGSWSEIGLASKTGSDKFVEQFGMNNFSPTEGIEIFKNLLPLKQITVTPVKVNWKKFFNVRFDPIPYFYSHLIKKNRWKRRKKEDSSKMKSLKKKVRSLQKDKRKQRSFMISEIQNRVAEVLQTETEEVDTARPLMELGMDSLAAIELRNVVNESTGLNLPATLLFDYPNIEKLSEYLTSQLDGDSEEDEEEEKEEINVQKQKRKGFDTTFAGPSDDSVAVIGYSSRLPTGTMNNVGNDPESFWETLISGTSCSEEIPPNRFDYEEYFDEEGGEKKMYVKWGTFINKPFHFDPQFFGISNEEAKTMDPQQRVLLETTWEALERSGLLPKDLVGSSTGVFIGNMFLDYKDLVNYYELVNYAGTGNHLSVLAGRISYVFGFQGPVITMDTACSSSLVSTHLACKSLRNRECNLAVAGGVNLLISPQNYISECAMRMLSPEGLCKTFDDSADGYLRGEGCGIVILKRLEDAKKDGDNIMAIIRGSSVNHDGRSAGLTAPNVVSQEKVIKSALKMANLSPADVDVIEAHGTGTSLGDPIEIRALTRVFGKNRKLPLYLSSVKTNIGHTEGCAGIAGLLKLILCLKNEQIPQHLHLKKINKLLPDLNEFKMVIPTVKPLSWKINENRKRIASVSSFGFSGTNAHLIIQEGVPLDESKLKENVHNETTREKYLFLSAKSLSSLKEMASNTIKFLKGTVGVYSVDDVCYTLNIRKSLFNCRLAIHGKTRHELINRLHAFVSDDQIDRPKKKDAPFVYTYNDVGNAHHKLVFCYTGQGSQFLGMGKELYENNSVFKNHMDRCEEILKKYLNGESIIDIIQNNKDKLGKTKYLQPALFSLEYSMTKMVEDVLGTTPDFLVGHSLGEVVAACIAGVMSLEDGLKLISVRGESMEASEKGSMAAIFSSLETVERIILENKLKVSIASVNGYTNTVVSGSTENVEVLLEALFKSKIKFKKLNVQNAFHSDLMDPILEKFKNSISEIKFNEPNIPIVSNLYGKIVEDFHEIVINKEYWSNHIRSRVDFLNGVKDLTKKNKNLVFVEVGPKPHLISMIKRIFPDERGVLFVQTIKEEVNTMHENLCKFFTHNVNYDISSLYNEDHDRAFISANKLPTYPFDEREFNCVPEEDRIVREMIYTINWEKSPIKIDDDSKIKGTVLCFSDIAEEFGRKMGEYFQKKNVDIIGVVATEKGGEFQTMNEEPPIFSIDPSNKDHYKTLLNHDVWKRKKKLTHVIHCMSLDIEDDEEPEQEDIENSVLINCGTIITILKMLKEFQLSPKFLYLTRNVYNEFTMFDKKGMKKGDDEEEDDDDEEELPSFLQSYIWGMVKAIRLEHPEFGMKIVDIKEDTKPAVIYEELLSNDENELSYLNGERYVPRLKPHRRKVEKKFIVRDNDCFIITGGTTGLGFAYTKFLIEKKGLKNAILLSRSGIKEERVKDEISNLKNTYDGLMISVVKSDVSDYEKLKKSLEEVCSDKKITGVLHCAGIFDNCLVTNQDFNRFHKLFLPKVYGTLNIHNVLGELEQELRYFILFSSDVSTFGDAGQSSYCAVNSFLDIFSGYRRSLGKNCTSINWGLFGDIGAVVKTKKNNALTVLKYSGQCLIDSKTSFGMFEEIMRNDISRMGAVRLHIRNLIRYKFNHQTPPLLKNIRMKSKRKSVDIGESREEEDVLSPMMESLNKTELSRKKFKTEEEFEQYQKNIIKKDIQEMVEDMLGKEGVDPKTDLQEIGVDSITALSIRNNLAKYAGIPLPVNMAFTNPNLDAIGNFVFNQKEKVVEVFKDKEKSAEKGVVESQNTGVNFFENVRALVKKFVSTLLREKLKDSNISDHEHLHELEANVTITNSVRMRIQEEYGLEIPVEEFFKTPTIVRYCNIVLRTMFKNIAEKYLWKEIDTDTKLPKSLGYIYNTNFIQVPKERPEKKLMLFMTPPAGMNPSFYRKMVSFFPSEVELCFVHLPGRTSRLNESLQLNMMKIANQIADAIEPIITKEKIPYALYGHCMGTQINYEVFCEIRRRKTLPLPKHFFVFSGHAPHITNSLFPSYELSDEGILEFIKQTNGGVLPKPLENKEMNKLVFSIMRADLEKVSSQDIVQIEKEDGKMVLYHNYYKEQLDNMEMPITSWGGGKDQFVPEKFVKQWKELTTGDFSFEIFPESDHYAYVDVMGEIRDEKIIQKIVDEVKKII